MTSSITMDNVSGEGLSPQSKEFGVYLRNLRKGKGLNQAELARLVTITSGYYGFFEQGRQIPSLKIINRLAEILDTDYLEMAMRAGYDELEARKKEVYRPRDSKRSLDDDHQNEHQINMVAADTYSERVADGTDAGTSLDSRFEANGPQEQEPQSQEPEGAPQTTNPNPTLLSGSGTRAVGLDEKRLDWAMGCISRDPTYKLADQFKQGELSHDVKVLVVQLYQAQTQRQLLTAEESLALSYTLHG